MKIAVIGAGAMGSIYAGLMADAGHEVWAIARGWSPPTLKASRHLIVIPALSRDPSLGALEPWTPDQVRGDGG